ncbi:hypothetical protein ACU4GD_14030 [Cupriavidus basilensis]
MITAAALTLGVVATGGATATLALTGRALTVAGSVVGPIAATMLRQAVAKGPLTGAMLALAVAMVGDTTYDAASNSFKYTQGQLPAGQVDLATGGWGNAVAGAACNGIYTCTAGDAATQAINRAGGCPTSSGYSISRVVIHTGTNGTQGDVYVKNSGGTELGTCGVISRLSTYVPPTYQSVPASDAQIGTAVAAPAVLAKVWDAGGCGAKITTYRDTASADDPCAQVINAPGGVWTPPTVPGGGSISFPPKTETTKDGAGNVIGTKTTTPTAQVAANTNQATMAASPVIVTPGSVVSNAVKNADGTTTTTTTTTTNPPQTKEQPQDGTATFSAGDASLYDKKSKTFQDVLTKFNGAINAAPWMQTAKGFYGEFRRGAVPTLDGAGESLGGVESGCRRLFL